MKDGNSLERGGAATARTIARACGLAGALALVTAVGALDAAGQGPGPTRTQWDGVFTQAQAERGAATYQAHCARCHGPALDGGEMSPALAGPAFAANWSGVSLGDLFDRTRKTMPLDNPASLGSKQYIDTIAFMLSRGEAPAGQVELDSRLETLQGITFTALKPEPR